jgi:D-amino-acid oxidase
VSAAPAVLVVGAGVSGLTTAICLAEAGLPVTIVSDRLPAQTTSSVAGAIWGAHLTEPGERTARWARQTLTELLSLTGESAAGVRIGSGVLALRPASGPRGGGSRPGRNGAGPPGVGPPDATPADLAGHASVQACEPASLPPGYDRGWRYSAALVQMPVYLDYLRSRCERAGATLEVAEVTSLTSAAHRWSARVVVNCTGAWARHLVPDPRVTPVRGQAIVAENPGLSEFFIGLPSGGHELVYVFPHGGTVILGGSQSAGDWSLEPDPVTAERIVADCAAVDPRLRGARVLAHRVGLRPFRPVIRVEAEPRAGAGPLVVHNYGHGGAGVTVSWGCARSAAAIVQRHLA